MNVAILFLDFLNTHSICLHKKFVANIAEVEKKMQVVMKQREERAAVAYELEKEKHVLRQLQGKWPFPQ